MEKTNLSTRENQIAELVAWGRSLKEIADFLGISPNTVDNQIQHIKKKIGCNKITEIAAWWFCTTYNISHQDSPIFRKNVAKTLIILFIGICIPFRGRNRTAPILSRPTYCRYYKINTSINSTYIIT